jgi:hypothetical protein
MNRLQHGQLKKRGSFLAGARDIVYIDHIGFGAHPSSYKWLLRALSPGKMNCIEGQRAWYLSPSIISDQLDPRRWPTGYMSYFSFPTFSIRSI